MQEVSQKFKELWGTPGKLTDVKFEINGVEYLNNAICPSVISRRMFANDAPSVGGVVQGTFSSTVVLKSDIPKHATVKVYNRIVHPDNGETSEWIRRGEFYINSRKGYRAGSELEFTAKDAIGKTNKPYIAYTAFRTWPQNENAVVGEIAQIIGVTVDSRTVLLGYPVPYPNDYTMREILGYIAAANCGNWTITDKNELRLVLLKPADDSSVIDIQNNVDDIKKLGDGDAYTGVKVWWADEDAYIAGTEDGAVLEIDCPWATQVMANRILAVIAGYSLHAYSATYADIPPSAEMGDIVRINGEDYQLLEYDVELNGTHQPNVGAPAYDEAEEEYEPELQRQLKRTVKLGQNYFGTTIDRENGILVQLYDSQGQPTGAYAKLNASTLEYAKNDGTKAIYFDPTTGEYIFNGKLIIRDGMLQFEGESQFVKVRYSTDKTAPVPNSWSEEWNSAWDNDTTEVWAIYSYNNGSTWKSPVLIQGKRGPQGNPGTPGSDANVPAWVKAYTQGAQFDTLVTDEWVVAMNLYGSKVFAGDSNSQYLELDDDGLKLFVKQTIDGVEQFVEKIKLGASDGSTWSTPFLRLGLGSYSSGTAFIKKTESGLFLGVAGYHVIGDQIAMIESISDPTEYNFTGVYVTGAELLHYKNGVPYSADSYLRFTD